MAPVAMLSVSGFIYLWTNQINGMMYIGRHKGLPGDFYVGSGKYFRSALAKYGRENFKRTILEHVEDEVALKIRERHYLDMFDAARNPQFYNISPNSNGGHHGKDITGANNPLFGKKHPNHVPLFGERNGMFGVHRCMADNPNARSGAAVSPWGSVFRFVCLKEWVFSDCPIAGDRGRIYSAFKALTSRKKGASAKRGLVKGWSIRYD